MKLPDFLTQDSYGYVHLANHRIGLRPILSSCIMRITLLK